jgi:hypothetical protein
MKMKIRMMTMTININFDKVVHSTVMKGESPEETNDLSEMLKEATTYITSFKWCQGIKDTYLGLGYPGILGVFLFNIIPINENVDEWIWIVVGDLPTAYISAYGFPNPATALDGYIGEMMKWVNAIKNKDDISELIPVNVPPTLEWATELESRLLFLKENILVDYEDDLKE